MTVLALFAGGAFDSEPVPRAPGATPTSVTEIIAPGDGAVPAAAVGAKVIPSIVAIEIGRDTPDGFFAEGSGSGVVLAEDGLIVTNQHVVDGADDIRVVLQNGRIYRAATLGGDVLTDLAVLEIEADALVPIELGSADDLRIGDPAVAVGNPLGLGGGPSLTVGVVSAFGREVQVGGGINDRLFGMIQTDAPITRGSSGGALVDAEGRLVGITTAIGVSDAGAEGIGFAIPVELVTRITDELVERGTVSHAFLGVTLSDAFSDQGPARVPKGADIVTVEPGTAAATFGLEVGDRIVELDGREVRNNQDVINTLRRYRVGDVAELGIVRDGETLSVEVTLGERPDDL